MKFESLREKRFLIFTCLLSAFQGLFYLYDGVMTGFSLNDFILAGIDFAYIPMVLIFRKKGFFVYICIGTSLLVYVNSVMETELFNNFSALLCLFMAIMIFPKYKQYLMIGYLIETAIAFALNDEPMYLFLIHTIRSMWLFAIYEFIIYTQYSRKPVVFTDEEKELLKQLCEGKQEKQLELNGYSESTIRRRLETARKRNGVADLRELKELYLNTYEH